MNSQIITNPESKLYIPKLFREILVETSAPIKLIHSGRSAAKSHSISRALLYLSSLGRLRVVCGRQYQRSIDDSVKELLDNIIVENNLNMFRSNNKQIIGSNGSKFTFIGLERSLGSIKGLEGIDIFWIEEGQYLTQKALDIILPTVRRNKGSELWISMNVDSLNDPCYEEFITNQRPGSIVKKITYMDNPFLDDGTIEEAMWCFVRDQQKYNHIWLGEPEVRSDRIVFKNWKVGEVKKPPEDTTYYYGLDFGYADDPSALVKCWIDEDNRILYIVDESYKEHVEIDHLPKFIEQVEGAAGGYIIADSSRPDTISYLKRNNIHVKGAKKGDGSVKEGIEFIQNYNIIVDPKCKNMQYELSHYMYKVDQDGFIIPKSPVDKDNHLIDALRYALEKYRKKVELTIYG